MLPFLSEEQTEAVAALSRFCREQVRPVVARYVREPDLPKHVVLNLLRQLAPFGLGTGRVPVEDGGMGLSAVTNGALLEAGIHHGDGFASYAFLNENVSMVLSRFGTPELKSRYLEPLVAGERIAAGAITEPSGGSDVSAVSTRAVRTANGFRITGRKVWISNGQHADFVTVLARDSETNQLDLYVVDRTEHGFDVEPLMTMGSVSTAELVFDGAEIPASHRLGQPGKGFGAVLAAFQEARAYVGIVANGLALDAQDKALEYAATRTQFGARSRASSWCRPCWPTTGSTSTRRVCCAFARWTSPTAGCRAPSRPRSPSCSPARRAPASSTVRCRSTAATARTRTSRWSACTAACASSGSSKAPRRSSAW